VNFSFISCKQLSLRTIKYILKDSFTSDRELVKMFSHADVGPKIQPYHNVLWHDVPTLTEMKVFNVKLRVASLFWVQLNRQTFLDRVELNPADRCQLESIYSYVMNLIQYISHARAKLNGSGGGDPEFPRARSGRGYTEHWLRYLAL